MSNVKVILFLPFNVISAQRLSKVNITKIENKTKKHGDLLNRRENISTCKIQDMYGYGNALIIYK